VNDITAFNKISYFINWSKVLHKEFFILKKRVNLKKAA